MRKVLLILCLSVLAVFASRPTWADVTGAIQGVIRDTQGKALAGALVTAEGGGTSVSATTQASGSFGFFSLPFGDYDVRVQASGYSPGQDNVSVGSDALVNLDLRLKPQADETEDLAPVTIQAARIRINPSASVSSQEINQTQISQLPGGATQSLPKVIYSTNPGFVEGSFGQVFARGNHANIQYDIDGIQLPDSPSGTFGDAFSVLNIDRMEVLTGGLPAEYGNRLSAVVNILTKSGTFEPGGFLDMNYGSFNTFSPQAVYGGSADGGKFRYFVSGNYTSTDRGLDTPEPYSEGAQNQGGIAAVHDYSTSNNQFTKLDWDLDDQNTLSLAAFNSQRTFQIPNYPAGFNPGDAFFGPNYSDAFGNVGGAVWSPYNADDYQIEGTDYAEVMWKHRFADDSVLQLAPYVKMSSVIFNGDPSADLAGAVDGDPSGANDGNPVTDDSFSEDRITSNLGLQGDYTAHLNDANTVKTGFQLQAAEAHGPISIAYQTSGDPVTVTGQDGSDHDYQESAYMQDDITIAKHVVLNAGLRYDAIQDLFADATSLDGEFQPRLGLNYTPWTQTKFHLYYGDLFQPAPAEDLRDSFSQVTGNLEPYDIKSEKDQYYEAGVAQQVDDQLISVNTYYKDAVNLLDDTQLLNTAITEPYNYSQGFVYGTELSINGKFAKHFSDFLTYSYEIAQGYGASGGLFALSQADLQTEEAGGDDFWQYLDHCEINTANAGLTWSLGGFTLGATGLYGSGLRTGFDNEVSLPPHFTVDGTVSYAITGKSWLEDVKVALDVTNVFDDVYPIFIDNGFNGSHYVAPTGFMVHVIKTL